MAKGPPSQRSRAISQIGRNSGRDGAEFRNRSCLISCFPAIDAGNDLHVSTTVRSPIARRPAHDVMCPVRPRVQYIAQHSVHVCGTYDGISSLHTSTRGSNGPATVAVEGNGEGEVLPRGARTLKGARDSEAALSGASYEVPGIPVRPANNGQRNWRIGVRVRLSACDEGANSMQAPPPALRRVGVCEVLDAPWVP